MRRVVSTVQRQGRRNKHESPRVGARGEAPRRAATDLTEFHSALIFPPDRHHTDRVPRHKEHLVRLTYPSAPQALNDVSPIAPSCSGPNVLGVVTLGQIIMWGDRALLARVLDLSCARGDSRSAASRIIA
jgi:hypothetical protein